MAAKVAIQYGIFGGGLRGGRMRRALKAAGYQLVSKSTDADIILAQSAGCFWLPEVPGRQRLLLIDPPYWPGRGIIERAKARRQSMKSYQQFGYSKGQVVRRGLVGLYYTFFGVRHNYRILRTVSGFDLEAVIQGHTAILVRNEHDDWLTPDLGQLEQANPLLRVIRLPGDHDDCWQNPQPYVNLLTDLQEL